MGLPAQLVLRDLDCRQQLQFGREQRSFLLVRGLAGAQVSKFSAWMTCDMDYCRHVGLKCVEIWVLLYSNVRYRRSHIFPNVTGCEHGSPNPKPRY